MFRLGGIAQISFMSQVFSSVQTRYESENIQEIFRIYNCSSEGGRIPSNEALIPLEFLNFLSTLLPETISCFLCSEYTLQGLQLE
jgi:hypothetical protein